MVTQTSPMPPEAVPLNWTLGLHLEEPSSRLGFPCFLSSWRLWVIMWEDLQVEDLALGDVGGGWVAPMEERTCPEGNQTIAVLN